MGVSSNTQSRISIIFFHLIFWWLMYWPNHVNFNIVTGARQKSRNTKNGQSTLSLKNCRVRIKRSLEQTTRPWSHEWSQTRTTLKSLDLRVPRPRRLPTTNSTSESSHTRSRNGAPPFSFFFFTPPFSDCLQELEAQAGPSRLFKVPRPCPTFTPLKSSPRWSRDQTERNRLSGASLTDQIP